MPSHIWNLWLQNSTANKLKEIYDQNRFSLMSLFPHCEAAMYQIGFCCQEERSV